MTPDPGQVRRRTRRLGLLLAAAALLVVAAPASQAVLYEPAGESGILDHGTGTTTVNVSTPVGDLQVEIEEHGLNGLLTGDPPSVDPSLRSCLDGCGVAGRGDVAAPAPAVRTAPTLESPVAAGSALATGRDAPTRSVAQGGARAPTRDRSGPVGTPLAVVATAAGLAAIVAYRRLTRDDLLDNDLRAAIVEIVEDEPGIHVSALADRLDVAPATIMYHARMLDEFDLLSLDEAGRETRCYSPRHGREVREVQRLLRSEAKRDLVDLVLESPGINMSQAARRLDRDRSTIKYHADRLEEAGLLVTDRDGAARRLLAADGLRDRLDPA